MSLRFLAHLGMAFSALFCTFFAFSGATDSGFSAPDFVMLEHALATDTAVQSLTPPWIPPFERPLSQLAFDFELDAWGLRASRFVLAHIFLHTINATLLFALFRGPLGPQVAAGAAILFALGLGFFGESVWRPANLSILLATTFVLCTGIVALRAQLERTPRRRFIATVLTAGLFFLSMLCHEAGVMGLVLLGGLMWPHRRSLSSVVRKLTLLVVLAAGAVILQLLRGHGVADLLLQASTWVTLPVRALHLLSLMVLPLAADAAHPSPNVLVQRMLELIHQTRPITGLFVAGAAVLWFIKAGGAVRWLLSCLFAFLVPLSLRAPTEPRLQLGEACLPAAFVCGLVALGFYQLWHRVGRPLRIVLGVVLVALLYGELAVVRGFDAQARTAGQSADSAARMQTLQAGGD
ncbi:MAG TPA: hypothetical protein VFD07_13505 [Candidatus Krumholzibacteria bacterium]|nr:hypothetical protein [Candidatus Krumholzibacteria bacterium]